MSVDSELRRLRACVAQARDKYDSLSRVCFMRHRAVQTASSASCCCLDAVGRMTGMAQSTLNLAFPNPQDCNVDVMWYLPCLWHCLHSMRRSVYVTVGCPSTCPSVPSFTCSSGGFAARRRAGTRYRSTVERAACRNGAAARRSAASAWHVESRVNEAEHRLVFVIPSSFTDGR